LIRGPAQRRPKAGSRIKSGVTKEESLGNLTAFRPVPTSRAQSGLSGQHLIGLQEKDGRSLFHPRRREECERSRNQVGVPQARQAIASRPEQGESEGGGEILRRHQGL